MSFRNGPAIPSSAAEMCGRIRAKKTTQNGGQQRRIEDAEQGRT